METLRLARPDDAASMLAIYMPYIRDTAITFETEIPSLAEFTQRAVEITKEYPWFVAEIDGVVAGYTYACAFRMRSAYRWTTEAAIYIHPSFQRRGLGRRLYASLFDELRLRGFANVMGVVALPNEASQALHAGLGFQLAGRFSNLGFKLGRWWDVEYWQLGLRSR